MLTLYHARTSVCAIKVRLVLAEKHLPWNSVLLALDGDQFALSYLRLNPGAVVPTLIDDGRVILDSTVIAHYLNEAFPGPALIPADPLLRAKLRYIEKLIDEHLHTACTLLSFATANRPRLLALDADALATELTRMPSQEARDAKRQAAMFGLDAPGIPDALDCFRRLIEFIATSAEEAGFAAGEHYSIADAAATPYIWRLEQLKLSRLWAGRPAVEDWYRRVRARPSFAQAVEDWITPADLARYAGQNDPWPKVNSILARRGEHREETADGHSEGRT